VGTAPEAMRQSKKKNPRIGMGFFRRIYASVQGELDSLRGAYCVVNMLSWLYDGRVKRKPLMNRLLQAYQQRWPLHEWLTEGIDENRLDWLIAQVLWRYNGPHPETIRFEWQGLQLAGEQSDHEPDHYVQYVYTGAATSRWRVSTASSTTTRFTGTTPNSMACRSG